MNKENILEIKNRIQQFYDLIYEDDYETKFLLDAININNDFYGLVLMLKRMYGDSEASSFLSDIFEKTSLFSSEIASKLSMNINAKFCDEDSYVEFLSKEKICIVKFYPFKKMLYQDYGERAMNLYQILSEKEEELKFLQNEADRIAEEGFFSNVNSSVDIVEKLISPKKFNKKIAKKWKIKNLDVSDKDMEIEEIKNELNETISMFKYKKEISLIKNEFEKFGKFLFQTSLDEYMEKYYGE